MWREAKSANHISVSGINVLSTSYYGIFIPAIPLSEISSPITWVWASYCRFTSPWRPSVLLDSWLVLTSLQLLTLVICPTSDSDSFCFPLINTLVMTLGPSKRIQNNLTASNLSSNHICKVPLRCKVIVTGCGDWDVDTFGGASIRCVATTMTPVLKISA